jgi:glycerate 2-kinase
MSSRSGCNLVDPQIFATKLLARLRPERLLERVAPALRRLPGPIHLACLGKPARQYERAISARLGERLTRSIAIGADDGGHPLPDERSVAAGEALMNFARSVPPADTFLFFVAGGGSALAECPRAPHTLETIRSRTRELIASGTSISEINAERISMSLLKGGGLGRACPAAHRLTLVLADVPTQDLTLVASGPVADGPIERVAGYPELAAAAAELLRGHAVDLAPALDLSIDDGISFHLDWIDQNTRPAPWALISGGELPVAPRGEGLGGRNSEFVVRLADALRNRQGKWRVLSLATDGTDGNSGAAGGWLDPQMLASGEAERAIGASDTATLLDAHGTQFRTGPTATNLMDLRVVLRTL